VAWQSHGGERVLSTIFDTISKKRLMKLVLIDLLNQGEHFDIDVNHIMAIFAQIIAFFTCPGGLTS